MKGDKRIENEKYADFYKLSSQKLSLNDLSNIVICIAKFVAVEVLVLALAFCTKDLESPSFHRTFSIIRINSVLF